MKQIKLAPETLPKLRDVDPRLVSYNVEMTEVTGGTFWKEYTPEQMADPDSFPLIELKDMQKMLQYYPPIDLGNARLRMLAKALGPVWVRVSGAWATDTYYDFDGHTGGKAPDGFRAVLTEGQWKGVLEFVKAVDGKLLVSVANSGGVHNEDGSWNPSQAKLLFDYSRDYGVPVEAAEFMNEPNTIGLNFEPVSGYGAADYARDQDLFVRFVRENYPGVLLVGPACCADKFDTGCPSALNIHTTPTEELIRDTKESLDVFSYHYYNGVSERGRVQGGHWSVEDAASDAYLAVADRYLDFYLPIRDRYTPGSQVWVTESGDAGCGGNTWGSTYLDVLRTLTELGLFAKRTDGIIFHNTLASSDYGFLRHSTFDPRPNYFAVLLWNRIMGTEVYDAGSVSEGAHVYAHSRRDGKPGMAYLIVNNSKTESTQVELPKDAERYTLEADGEDIKAPVMLLNGAPLVLDAEDKLPALTPVTEPQGVITLKPGTCTFLVL